MHGRVLAQPDSFANAPAATFRTFRRTFGRPGRPQTGLAPPLVAGVLQREAPVQIRAPGMDQEELRVFNRPQPPFPLLKKGFSL